MQKKVNLKIGMVAFISLMKIIHDCILTDCLCGLVVRVHGFRFRGLDSILSAAKFSEK
jgi:hypothetical protein